MKVTARWVKNMRRKEWEGKNNFDHHDLERTWTSKGVLPEDLPGSNGGYWKTRGGLVPQLGYQQGG